MSRSIFTCSLAIFFACSSYAAKISSDGEVVESTPAPPKGFPEEATPSPTESEAVLLEPKSINEIEKIASEATAAQPLTISNKYIQAMRAAADSFRKRDFDEAFVYLDQAEKLNPTSPDIINFRGAVYAEKLDFVEAKKLYELAKAQQPTAFWPPYNLAEIDFMQKQYPAAREAFMALMKQFPENELLRFKIILTYLLEGKKAEAKIELEKFTFPSNTAAYYFAWAAWEFSHGRMEEGNKWVTSGTRIFGREKTDFVYQSIADLKWVPMPRP